MYQHLYHSSICIRSRCIIILKRQQQIQQTSRLTIGTRYFAVNISVCRFACRHEGYKARDNFPIIIQEGNIVFFFQQFMSEKQKMKSFLKEYPVFKSLTSKEHYVPMVNRGIFYLVDAFSSSVNLNKKKNLKICAFYCIVIIAYKCTKFRIRHTNT